MYDNKEESMINIQQANDKDIIIVFRVQIEGHTDDSYWSIKSTQIKSKNTNQARWVQVNTNK